MKNNQDGKDRDMKQGNLEAILVKKQFTKKTLAIYIVVIGWIR